MTLQGPHQVAKKSMTTIWSAEPSSTEVLNEVMLWSWLTPPFLLDGVGLKEGAEDVDVDEERACSSRSFCWWYLTYSARLWTPILLVVCVKCVGFVVEKCLATGNVLVLRLGSCRTAGVVVDLMIFWNTGTRSDVATLEVFILMEGTLDCERGLQLLN